VNALANLNPFISESALASVTMADDTTGLTLADPLVPVVVNSSSASAGSVVVAKSLPLPMGAATEFNSELAGPPAFPVRAAGSFTSSLGTLGKKDQASILGAALAEPLTVAADLDRGGARPNSGLDSRDRGQDSITEPALASLAAETTAVVTSPTTAAFSNSSLCGGVDGHAESGQGARKGSTVDPFDSGTLNKGAGVESCPHNPLSLKSIPFSAINNRKPFYVDEVLFLTDVYETRNPRAEFVSAWSELRTGEPCSQL
jgi:hypothetical protein